VSATGIVTGSLDARELLELAATTATTAGRLVVEQRRGGVEVADTKTSPTDIVTAVDLASESLIRRLLLAARPDDSIVGEEGSAVSGDSGVTWVVDPIDGTVNFLYGIPQFAVSIAAQVDGESLVGVVHNPTSGETFTAMRGDGAWLGDQQLHVSACTRLDRALVGTGFAYRADVRAHQATETLRLVSVLRDIRRLGSAALDLCFVAAGRLDGYVERGLKPWDLAAGGLIAAEAGAVVSGLRAEAPSELLVIAAPPLLHPLFEAALLDAGFADWPLSTWPE
jgi:myo-inositol-1(or 4)-monophosphatase